MSEPPATEPAPEEPGAEQPRRSGLPMLLTVAIGAVLVGGVVSAAVLMADEQEPPVRIAEERGEGLAPTSGAADAPLPDRELPALRDEEAIQLAGYQGAPLVVNFWATWCAPCLEEMPDLQQVSEELAGSVAVLGVNVQDEAAEARRFVDDLGITYDLAVDGDGSLLAAVEGFGMPTTLLVDPSGTIVYRHTGLLDAERLRELLDEHLGVGGPEETGVGGPEEGNGAAQLAARGRPK